MAHYSRLYTVVIDVPADDHERELAFWRAAIGEPLVQYERFPEYHGGELLHGQEFRLLIQRLGHGPGRVHLDIHTDDLDAEVARLEGLGAERVQQMHALVDSARPSRDGVLRGAGSRGHAQRRQRAALGLSQALSLPPAAA